MDKNITKEELLAFFEDRCGGAEAERIARYLQEHPEVVGEFFPEEEWMQFQPAADLPDGWSEKWWENIRARRITVYRNKASWPFIRVAAAVLVVAGLTGFLLLDPEGSRRKLESAAIDHGPAASFTVRAASTI